MATIRMNLSSKQQKGNEKHEILLRISLARNKVFRAKSNLYVHSKYWDTKKEKIIVPRIHVKEQGELITLQKQLDDLCTFILDKTIKVSIEKISKSWVESIVHEFHFGSSEIEKSSEGDFFEIVQIFISSRVKPGNRAAQFGTLIRLLKRYELYRGKGFMLNLDNITDMDLVYFESFLRAEHTFFDKNGVCIKYKNIYRIYNRLLINSLQAISQIYGHNL